MPRNNGIYSPPPGTGGTPQTAISSAMFNAWVADITADQNNPRPVIAGGTGAATAAGALQNLAGGANGLHSLTGKTTPVDADEIGIADSAASWGLKKLTWANLKGALKTYLDTLYLSLSGGTMTGHIDMNGFGTSNNKTLTDAGLNVSSPVLADANNALLGSFASFAGTDAVCVAANFPSLNTGTNSNRWWNIITLGAPSRTTQIAQEVFGIGTYKGRTFRREKHDSTWGAWIEFADRPWTELAPVATTSGTAIDWTSIPAGVTEIEMWWNTVSGNSTDHFIVQIGTGGSPTTTGYGSGSAMASAGGARVIGGTGFIMCSNDATYEWSGVVRLRRITGNTWVSEHTVASSVTNGVAVVGGGRIALAGALNNIRLRSLGGTQAFDNGSVQVRYR